MNVLTWHFQCRHCKTWAVTVVDAGPYVRCNGCGGAKKFMFSDRNCDPEVYDYALANGIAHLPLPRNVVVTCVRCGEDKIDTVTKPDGLVCRECVAAEPRPDVQPLTPEQIAAAQKAADEQAKTDREWERFGMYERMDAKTGE